jgi:hypothetical protein
VLQYKPAVGLSDNVNHSVVADTSGKFTSVKALNGKLYMADSLGTLQSYDGSAVNYHTNTPFSGTNYVSAMTEFNGKSYFGTSNGEIYAQDGDHWTQVQKFYGMIVDMCSWRGELYAAPWSPHGGLYKTNGTNKTDAGFFLWDTLIDNVYGTANAHLLPTDNFLYTGVVDSGGSHSSTVRRTSDGTRFDTIGGPGPFKWDYGALSHDGIVHFFLNGNAGGPDTTGSLLTDDGQKATTTSMQYWPWRIRSAVELNGEIYAIANLLDQNGLVSQQQYLVTTASTVPEPSTVIAFGSLSLTGVAIAAWRRRKKQ